MASFLLTRVETGYQGNCDVNPYIKEAGREDPFIKQKSRNMNVAVTTKEDIIIISIEGKIDSKTSGEIQSQVLEKVNDTVRVILDLSRVDFVSSAGLRLLLMIYRQIKLRDGKVVLTGVAEEIRDVMAMTGFINFFEFSDTLEEACELFVG